MERAASSMPPWGCLAIRGAISIAFGIVALSGSALVETIAPFILVFGGYAIADGLAALLFGASLPRSRDRDRARRLVALDGALGLAAGIVAFARPHLGLAGLLVVVGVRFIAGGLVELAASLWLRRSLESSGLFGLAGLASLALGVMALAAPGTTELVLVVMLGAYALAFGSLLLAFAFRILYSTRGGSHVLGHAT
jgi:uncharacterized membrane protein HdeD (DUF308 family)